MAKRKISNTTKVEIDAPDVDVTTDLNVGNDLDVTKDISVTGSITSVTNVTVSGDLTVNGTETIINTTDLSVTDKNITVNDTGNDASSEGAGLTVERTGTDGSIVYEDALTSKFKLGSVGSEVEVADVSSSQTYTNKTLTSPAINGGDINLGTATDTDKIVLSGAAKATLDGLTSEAGSLYYATDEAKAYLDNGTSLVEVGSGSGGGGGGNNLITNPDFEANTTGWNSYNDGAVAEPVDGDSGVAAGTSITRETSAPLNGTASGKISKGALNYQGEGISTDITLPASYEQQSLRVSFDWTINLGTYADGDVGVYMYDVTNTTMTKLGDLDSQSGYFNTTYTTSDSNSYRLIFHVQSTSASAYTIDIDDVTFARDGLAVVTNTDDWKEFTMTIDASTSAPTKATSPAFDKAFWRRVGDSMEIRYSYQQTSLTGAANGSGTYLFKLPGSYKLNFDKLAGTSTGTGDTVGTCQTREGAADNHGTVFTHTDQDDCVRLQMNDGGSDFGVPVNSSQNGLASNASVRYSFVCTVPIQGWSTTFAFSESGPTVAARYKTAVAQTIATATETDVNYDTLDYDTHSSSTTSPWEFTAPTSGVYWVDASVLFQDIGWTAGNNADLRLKKNGSVVSFLDRFEKEVTSTDFVGVHGTDSVYLEAGDTIRIAIFHNRGANTNFHSNDNFNFVSVKKIGSETTVVSTTGDITSNVYLNAINASGQAISGSTTITNWTKVRDSHNAFNATTGLFTVPSDGEYMIYCSVALDFTPTDNRLNTVFTSVEPLTSLSEVSTRVGASANSTGGIYHLKAGDTFDIQQFVSGGSGNLSAIDSGQRTRLTVAKQGTEININTGAGPAVKWAEHLLSADVSSDGSMSDLTFNNLEIGKTYKASLSALLQCNATDGGIGVTIEHDGNTIGRANADLDPGGTRAVQCFDSVIFVATATTVTFDAASTSANAIVRGDGTRNETSSQLEEIPFASQTSDWN